MTSEKLYVRKTYYQTFTENNESKHPTETLGVLFNLEQQKEMADLAYLRFAQGEVYFHNKDYETAIFKWGNVNNELMPWALKNIADAHVELDLLQIAEEYYQSVHTDSSNLKTEVLLQLFSLYKQRGKLEMATTSIKQAVDLNPDYPGVTDLAREFFEEQHDFSNAVVLAIDEAIRTESFLWFEVLESYIEQGHTVGMESEAFRIVLMTLYSINQVRFESLLAALWRSYAQNDLSLEWLKDINHLLLEINPQPTRTWNKLTKLYEETYVRLMNGNLLIDDLFSYIPNHLTNWLKISSGTEALVAATAVLAWNETYPAWIVETVISEAEEVVSHSGKNKNGLEDVFEIFTQIRKWANTNEIILNEREEWLINELYDKDHFHLMITGSEAVGKSILVNELLGKELSNESTSARLLFKHADQMEIHAITDGENKVVALDDFEWIREDEQTLISFNMPLASLHQEPFSIIDMPGLANRRKYKNELSSYLNLADGLIYVLDASLPLTYHEIEPAIKIKEQVSDLPIHFLLSGMGQNTNNEETSVSFEEAKSWIQTYFSDANVFLLHSFSEHASQVEEVTHFIQSMVKGYKTEDGLKRKVLHASKQLIKLLLEKQVELENALRETMKWNEEIATKLDGALNQLNDLQEEKVQVIQEDYSFIKDEMRQTMLAKIPSLLVSSADLVKEDSDFDNLDVTLNDEMNKRINHYIDTIALPNLTSSIIGWIAKSEVEFKGSKEYLDEMSEGLNQLYNEEKISFDYDFKVLEDWQRDVNRMTSGSIQLEKTNILKGSASSQFILKNADKLFGVIIKNKGVLQDKYKNFVQTKDYSKTAESITDAFMQQFEFFERSLERDIKMFFANPYAVLNKAVEEKQAEIQANEHSLNNMRENPEVYTNPLTLFQLKIRQYEWMDLTDEMVYEYR